MFVKVTPRNGNEGATRINPRLVSSYFAAPGGTVVMFGVNDFLEVAETVEHLDQLFAEAELPTQPRFMWVRRPPRDAVLMGNYADGKGVVEVGRVFLEVGTSTCWRHNFMASGNFATPTLAAADMARHVVGSDFVPPLFQLV